MNLINKREYRDILCDLWVSTMDSASIVEHMRKLPGLDAVNYHMVRKLANRMGVRRPADRSRTYAQKQAHVKAQEWRSRNQAPVIRARSGAYDASWPEAQIALLEELWRAGLSTREIGDRLGCTKNAVVGKAHRLMERGILEPRPSPIIRNGNPTPPRKPRPVVVGRTIPPLPSELAPALPPAPPVALKPVKQYPMKFFLPPSSRPATIPVPRRPRLVADHAIIGPSRKPCQWVTQDGSVLRPWIFCGIDCDDGVSYCEDHARRVFNNYRPRIEQAA